MSASNEIPQAPTTAAFFLQAAIAFAVSLGTAVIGILYLPIDPWQRGFLAITMLFLTSSTFTLAKVVRDRQEQTSVRARIDGARMDKLIAEHDPFKNVA
ncbi:YiaA/YiaB family inner membrane protein [Gordonia sp. PKS22-38]|uniref:YiaA/YiaB family inner membrane protein n=1 Tax=Gordonia prachuapensis TaxID=3115651 RepID=A0ABU7MNJ6_9ACTN|nr:YiaA/YiaB family inner membrane protein [Gordonia sp. PKS22-38]